jgi:hypothetical protein
MNPRACNLQINMRIPSFVMAFDKDFSRFANKGCNGFLLGSCQITFML